MELRQLITCFTRLASPLMLPPTRSLWPPTYLVSEHSEISAPHFSGVWNIGPSIVLSTTTGGRCPCVFSKLVSDRRAGGEIDKTVGRIGGGFDEDQSHPAFRARRFGGLAHFGDIDAVGKAESGDAECAHLVLEQRFGAAIEGPTMQNGVARPEKGEQRRRNRRHAAGEDGGTLGLIPDRQPILKDFEVGIVEARIDQTGFFARSRLTATGGKIEEILALLGVLENESRGQKDRRLERAFRKTRRIAVAHHQRLGMQAAIGYAVLVVIIIGHGAEFLTGG